MKYAVVENGRNQEMVREGEKVLVDAFNLEPGKEYLFEKVLLKRDGDDIQAGTPYIDGAMVSGKVLGEFKGPKVINFKKKRRKGYKRKVGHRQMFTEIEVVKIK